MPLGVVEGKSEIRCMMTRRAEPERHHAACRYVAENPFYGLGREKEKLPVCFPVEQIEVWK